MQAIEIAHAPVAQLDRVTDYESVGQGFESLPAYQKKSRYPFGYLDFFVVSGGTRKAGPGEAGVKTVRWTVFRPWESPLLARCIPHGM